MTTDLRKDNNRRLTMKLINEKDIKVGYYLSYYDENTDDTMEWKFVDPKKLK